MKGELFMKREIKIIMHTHWDREWYFTKEETKVLLRNHMFEVIEYLEKNPDITYILDGQSIIIDDFLEFSPKWENRLKTLISKGNLKVGPWYTQTDLLMVHSESIIRNLYYGIKKALEYGKVMKIGYAPDTFGHSSQMPQIYKQFGIESTFFWRGFSELKAQKSDFLWEGVDGSTIFGINLATGYQGAKYLEEDENELKLRMDKLLNVLDRYSATSQRLIMNGHDQMPIQKNIKNIINNMKKIYPNDNIEISNFESYVENLKNSKLEKVTGELIHSKHSRIHKTITSTRMDIKLLNSKLEYKIYNILEPLSILATNLNIDYPYEIIEKSLKTLFGTHAHDSIGGCNSDMVNKDIKQRLIETNEIIDSQIELYMRLISLASNQKNSITLYNFLPYERNYERVEMELITRTSDFEIYDNDNKISYEIVEQEIVDAGLIDRQVAARLLDIKVFKTKIIFTIEKISGLEIKYLHYKEGRNYSLIDNWKTENSIENPYYKLIITDNKINLYDKTKNKMIENIIFIESSGDAGDSYDYSPPHKDLIFNNENSIYKNIKVLKNKDNEKIKFDIKSHLPKNQSERNIEKISTLIEFNIEITLDRSELISINLKHKNKVQDTRYRVAFNTEIKSDFVESDSHLCVVKKPIYLKKELEVWERENWAEKPVSIETFNSYVSLKENNNTATIFTEGLKEYEVIDSTIYITLFRTFSHLGKRELINRPGRPSGIEIETKDNQLEDSEFEFKLAISLIDSKKNRSEQSKEFLTSIMGYQLKEFNRFNINPPIITKNIKTTYNLNLNGCVVSAFMLSEDDRYIYFRIFNPTFENKKLKFDKTIYLSNMFQEKLEKVEEISIKPQEILNFLLKK